MSGLVLDAGGLIAFERARPTTVALVSWAIGQGAPVRVPAGCLAQVWRDPVRQVRLTRLLRQKTVDVRALDGEVAAKVGRLLGATSTTDVVDGHVAVLAMESSAAVITSDGGDIRRLAPLARIVDV